MPKIKLKPHLGDIEVGIGNLVNLKVSAGETIEVAEEALGALLGLGHFEQVHDAQIKEPEKPKKQDKKDAE